MAETRGKKVLMLLFLVCLTGIIGLGAYSYILYQEKTELTVRVDELESRSSLLQRKYAEQKRQADELLRIKSRLEGLNRVSQSDLDELEEQKQALKREIESMKAAHVKLEDRIECLVSDRSGLQEELKEIKSSYRQIVEDFHRDLVRVVNTNEDLRDDLERKDIEIERCVENNKALCDISGELIMKYENKGVIGSFAEKEPLTQIKKVALEEYIQEYTDKIDSLKIGKQAN